MRDLFLTRDAYFSTCGRYRYRLMRCWDHHKLPLPWVMLNPSTADDEDDDPTIRRCMAFARREGAGGIEVVNLFALRSTDPRALRLAADPIGPENDEWIREVLRPYSQVVAAWGEHGGYLDRGAIVLRDLRRAGLRVLCFGDKPRHPLYQPSDRPLVELPIDRLWK